MDFNQKAGKREDDRISDKIKEFCKKNRFLIVRGHVPSNLKPNEANIESPPIAKVLAKGVYFQYMINNL